LQKGQLHAWALIREFLPHAILKADLILLADCLDFNAEVVDDGEGTSGNELREAAKAERSSGAARAE
jgi:hypothetical protein